MNSIRIHHWLIPALILALSILALAACDAGDDDDDDNIDDDTVDDDDDTADDDDSNDGLSGQTQPARIPLDLVEGCNPFQTSDECILPYPSSFFQKTDQASPTGVRNDYPAHSLPIPPGTPPINMDPTNTADGVSPFGPILVHFGVDIDPDDLTYVDELEESVAPGNPIALFNLETGKRVIFMSEMDMNRKERYPGRYALIIRPLEPMDMSARHVVVLTKDLNDDQGSSFDSPEAFAVLRDDILTFNPEIEAVREKYEGIFDFLEDHGYQRQDLLLAWDFMVASQDYLLGSVLSMREVALTEGGMGYTINKVQDDPNQWCARLVEGTFEVPTYLNENSVFVYDENHHPVRQAENQSFEFTMVIPKKAETLGEPLPLAVFGHGLFGSGRSYMSGWGQSVIHPIAEENGVIMIATDWIGLSSGDLDLILENVVPDLNNISLVTDRLQQSLVNNITMTELAIDDLAEDPQIKLGENDLIDDTRIYYYGVSLGGIQGSSFVSISDRVTRGVLAVPGSVWLNMFPRSIHWIPIKLLLDITYPDPLLQQMGIAILQTRFDLSDPGNLSHLMFKDPLPDAPEGRIVVIQEAIGDSQVPNMTTETLARAMGVKLMTPSVTDVYGLDTATSPSTEAVMVQYYLKDQVEANPPPTANIPPTVENGAHADMVFLPHVQQQVLHFMQTGEIEQYCDGPCDPD